MMRELWAWLRELWLLRGTEDQAARRIAAEWWRAASDVFDPWRHP